MERSATRNLSLTNRLLGCTLCKTLPSHSTRHGRTLVLILAQSNAMRPGGGPVRKDHSSTQWSPARAHKLNVRTKTANVSRQDLSTVRVKAKVPLLSV